MTTLLREAAGSPRVIQTLKDMRDYVAFEKRDGHSIALVPTMGALHDGHISLVKQALKTADKVIVSIFVNPTQFGPDEDFDSYPRTWDQDLRKLADAGAHAVYHPAVDDMYDQNAATTISVGGVSDGLCGAHRPGHFDGVALIVTKLLLQVQPDIAIFGEKDWQQLQVIKRMVADLNIPVDIQGAPIVRDENGLALSSRNAYLSSAQYKIAIQLNKILRNMAEEIREGTAFSDAIEQGKKDIIAAGFDDIDYLDIRPAQTLRPLEQTQATMADTGETPLRVLVAAYLGKARLIDNLAV